MTESPLTQQQLDQMWRDAWALAVVGAVNPTAVASTLAKYSSVAVHALGTREAEKLVPLRAMAGHLAALFGQGFGPDVEVLDEVIKNGQRLGICNERGEYVEPAPRS